ncbi:MAG TPA: glycosyl hydrolase family 18 protein [Candidatus Limnocylindrales bacterium]
MIGGRSRALVLVLGFIVIGCDLATAPSPPGSPAVVPPAGAPSAEPSETPSSLPSARPLPSVSPVPPVATPPGTPVHDRAKFGFLAKGMSHEVMAFVTSPQVDYALGELDFDTISTIAYFSITAGRRGNLAADTGWRRWNSAAMRRLIDIAHAHGTKVVFSLKRFSWTPSQTAVTRGILGDPGRWSRLARETAAEVVRRGVDGVNVDFEPIPLGQRDAFTRFVRALRAELDRRRPGSQLTFDVTGHHTSYDVRGLLAPGGADAVYLMGYHYAGTWSRVAGSTAPLGGPRYDVRDTVRRLLRQGRPEQIIVGVPYYGHLWPTARGVIRSRTTGGGFDVTYDRAARIGARLGARYDPVEQVHWVAFREGLQWYQLYYDDARSLAAKWTFVKRQGLLGTGVWTIGFEGRAGPLDAAMRRAFLVP